MFGCLLIPSTPSPSTTLAVALTSEQTLKALKNAYKIATPYWPIIQTRIFTLVGQQGKPPPESSFRIRHGRPFWNDLRSPVFDPKNRTKKDQMRRKVSHTKEDMRSAHVHPVFTPLVREDTDTPPAGVRLLLTGLDRLSTMCWHITFVVELWSSRKCLGSMGPLEHALIRCFQLLFSPR